MPQMIVLTAKVTGRHYPDMVLLVPDEMTVPQATELILTALDKVKTDRPHEPRDDALAAELAPLGITRPNPTHVRVDWVSAPAAAPAAFTPEEEVNVLKTRVAELESVLESLWLYVGRYEVSQLTTAQKELLADVIDADHERQDIEDGHTGTDMAYSKTERWWR